MLQSRHIEAARIHIYHPIIITNYMGYYTIVNELINLDRF